MSETLRAVCLSLFYAAGGTERGRECSAALPCPSPKEPSLRPHRCLSRVLCVDPGRFPSPHTGIYTDFALGAAKTFRPSSGAHTQTYHRAGVGAAVTSLCGDPPDRNAFPLWDVWASPWTTRGRSVWNLSVCGKASRVALKQCRYMSQSIGHSSGMPNT